MRAPTLGLPSVALLLIAACGGSDDTPAADSGPTADASDPTCLYPSDADQPVPAPISTPRWAFRPWISKDISTGDDTRAFVDGFASRKIPVGAVVIDSPWETHYNTFVPDPVRYPDFPTLVSDLHGQGIKLVLWTTSMVNESSLDLEDGGTRYDGPSPNFQRGLDCGFYVNDGARYLWWKGFGASLDFSDRHALAWWHRQQDAVLDLGIDGWKLDFGEQYITDLPVRTDGGAIDLQAYSEAYYRDFYAYGRSKRGNDFVTMVRPYDASYGFGGRFYARPEHAPVAWVGDNRRDWVGVVDALDHMFRSSLAGYPMVGSDIGGYLDKDDEDFNTSIPFDTLVFARWTALSALTPFMQLHGRANITPWTVPDNADKMVIAYRYWSTVHDEMVPYLYSLVAEAHAGGPMPVRPVGTTRAEWEANGWTYRLGDHVLVSPQIDPTPTKRFRIPDGAWYTWWSLANAPVRGPTDNYQQPLPADDLRGYPLMVGAGAILPLHVTNELLLHGTADSADALTVMAFPAPTESSFVVHDEDGLTTTLGLQQVGDSSRFSASRTSKPIILRMRVEGERDTGWTVMRGDVAVPGLQRSPDLPTPTFRTVAASRTDVFLWDPNQKLLWIRLMPVDGPLTLTATRPPLPPPPPVQRQRSQR